MSGALLMAIGATLLLASMVFSGMKRVTPVRREALRRRHVRRGVLRPLAGDHYDEPRSFVVVDPTIVLTRDEEDDVDRIRGWHTQEIPKVEADGALFPTPDAIAQLDTIHRNFQNALNGVIDSATSALLQRSTAVGTR